MSRSPYNTYRIPTPTDLQIVELFDNIVKPFEQVTFSVTIGNAQMGSYRDLEHFKQDESYSKDKFSRQITRVDANFQNTQVEFTRYIQTPQGTSSSLWEAEIAFYPTSGSLGTSLAKHISAEVDKFLRKGTKSTALRNTSEDISGILASEVIQLAAMQRQIVVEAEEARVRRDEKFEERKIELEQEFLAAKRKAEDEIEAEKEKLNILKQDLESERKRLDDSSHMHARREMREKITQTLRERLKTSGVPSNSEALRSRVFMLCAVAAATFVAIATFSAVELTQLLKIGLGNPIPFYIASARFAASSAAAGGTVFYLLGWFKRLHDNDLRAHRDLERYLYDVDRASWVVETMLESQRKGENELPAEIPHDWVLGVTHGLFARAEPRDESQATMEALGSLLNFAAEAELGPQGPRIKLTKAGIKRLSRSGTIESDAG